MTRKKKQKTRGSGRVNLWFTMKKRPKKSVESHAGWNRFKLLLFTSLRVLELYWGSPCPVPIPKRPPCKTTRRVPSLVRNRMGSTGLDWCSSILGGGSSGSSGNRSMPGWMNLETGCNLEYQSHCIVIRWGPWVDSIYNDTYVHNPCLLGVPLTTESKIA